MEKNPIFVSRHGGGYDDSGGPALHVETSGVNKHGRIRRAWPYKRKIREMRKYIRVRGCVRGGGGGACGGRWAVLVVMVGSGGKCSHSRLAQRNRE